MSIGSSLTMSVLAAALVASSAYGAEEVAQTFTLDGRLYADTAGSTPLTDSDVTIVLQVLNPAQNCILYEETQTHFDAAIGNGYFTLQIGSAVGAGKRSSLDSAHSMAIVYSNTGGNISGRTLGGSACSYSPSSGDGRYVRMLVTPSSDGVTRTLSPNMALDSVPMATVAERAESVQGLSASQLLQVNTTGSEVLSQSNLENVFSSSNYSALTSLLSGSSNMYSKAASNGTSVLPNVSSPATPSAGQMWYDGGSIKYYDGSSTKTLGTAGSGITSLTIGTGLTPTGTISSSGSIAVDVGTTAGKIVQVASGDKLPAIDGSALTNLNGSAVNSGTIGGTTAVNTSGNITTTGNISGVDISASGNASVTGNVVASGNGSFAAVSSKQLSLYDDAVTNTNYVTLKTPATGTLTSDYTLTLPPALPGVSGQVLTSDTSGVLSWSSPSTGSVTSVTSSGAPIVIGGSASAPTVGVNAATTAASGVVQLAASGGTTAGTVVQANDSRLSDSRTPNGGASGDLSGTYPSPTVAGIQGKTVTYTTLTTGDHLKYDGSGWVNAVLSAADLSDSSDLLKASNMPATCAADKTLTFSSPTGTWVCSSIAIDAAAITSGTIDAARLPAEAKYWESATGGINYAGGNVGIGTTTPSANLDIQGSGEVAMQFVSSGDMTSILANAMNSTNWKGNYYTAQRSRSGFTAVQAGDTIYQLHAMGNDGNGNFQTASQISMEVDGSVAAGIVPGSIIFKTSNTSGTLDSRMIIKADGNVGIGTTSPSEKLEVAGKIKGTELCIGTDCRSGWPGSGGGGTVTSVGSGTGLTGGPITSTGTLAVDVGTTAGKIVQVDTGDKLPVIDGSQLTNLNASNLGSGTVAAARMPALTGDVTTSAGSVATTLAQIQGKTLTVSSPTSGDLLKYDGSGWVNSALSSADLSDASSLIKSTQMPTSCGADHTLTFSSPTGTWACTSIAIDAAAITSGTIDAARLPAEAKYWEAATGGINYAGGNVGIGTTVPATKLEVVGGLRLSGSGTDTTTTPLGASISTKINVPPYDPGSYGQVVFMGIPSTSQATSRVLSIADARTVAHQPSINLLSPDENHYFGLSFDGGNTTGYLKSDLAVGLRPGGTVDALTALASGNVGIGTTSPTALLHLLNGDIYLDDNANVGRSIYLKRNGVSMGALSTANTRLTLAAQNSKDVMISDTSGSGIIVKNGGNVGIGTTSPSEKLEVAGKVKGTELCIGTDCRSTWPTGSGGTVTSVGSGTGLTGGPITSTGTLAVDVGTTAGKIVQVDTGDKLPVIDGSQLTNLNASNLASGTVAAARMPALTGDVTTSAGSVATTLAKIQGKTLTVTSPTSGDFLKYDGSGWVNSALSSAALSDASDLLKASNMPANCSASQTLTFSSPTGTWVCSNIAIDAAAITSGTIDDARLPASSKYWQAATGGIHYSSGNVGVGTTTPATALHIKSDTGLRVEEGNASFVRALNFLPATNAGGIASMTSNSSGRLDIGNSNTTLSLLSGNVGIGTTTPSFPLHVASDSAAVGVISQASANASSPVLGFRKARGSHSSLGAVSAGDSLGRIDFVGYNDAYRTAASIEGVAETGFGATGADAPGRLVFSTSSDGFATPSERMRITSAGAVGIGTATPTSQLTLYGAQGGVPQISMTNTTTTGYTYSDYVGTGASFGIGVGNAAESLFGVANKFFVYDHAVGMRMVIDSSGNMGIGTVSPSSYTNFGPTVEAKGGYGGTFQSTSSDDTVKGGFFANSAASALGIGTFVGSNKAVYFETNGLERMRISAAGNVGIGTTAPGYPLQINTSAYYGLLIQNSGNSYGGYAEMSNSGGVAWGGKNTSTGANGGLGYAAYGVWCGAGTCGGASGWTNFSDRRLKRDIQSIENPLEKILRLDGVTYHWREAKRDVREGQKIGLIAQDVEKVFPQAVKTDTLSKDALPGGTKMITYTDLVAPIIAAIKEFHQKWFADSAELHAQLEQVKSENAAMKTYLCQKDPSAPFCR